MKVLLSLLLGAVFLFVAAAQQARADVLGLSIIAYDDANNVYSYGLTEIYNLELRPYYDAAVDSYLFDGETGAVLGGGFALAYGYAEVSDVIEGYGDKLYGLINDHYVGGYFQVYEPPILYTWDPVGFSFLSSAEYPGTYSWFAPLLEVYRQYQLFYLGSTLVSIAPPLKATIAEVGFTGDITITKYTATKGDTEEVIDSPDGSSPVWVRGGKNDPAAYTQKQYLNMFGTIRFTSRQAPGTAAKVRVRRGGESAEVSATISGNTLRVDNLRAPVGIGSNPPNHGVKREQYDYTWEISVNNGSTWSSLGTSGPHVIYYTFDAPIPNPFNNSSGTTYPAIYDKALAYACSRSGNSLPIRDVIFNITHAMGREGGDMFYDPGLASTDDHPLVYLDRGTAQCIDNGASARAPQNHRDTGRDRVHMGRAGQRD